MNVNSCMSPEQLGFKFASALLMYYKEISTNTIRAMPFFEDFSESDRVIDLLLNNYSTEIHLKQLSKHPFTEWEEIIKLKE